MFLKVHPIRFRQQGIELDCIHDYREQLRVSTYSYTLVFNLDHGRIYITIIVSRFDNFIMINLILVL